ncbi:MAG: glycosyltransferase family 2 protein [Elusimicrobiales bacterium]
MYLSVVLPVYNERENIGPLSSEIARMLDALGKPCEVIFVDDGSADGSYEAAAQIAAGDGRFRAARLARNFGQTAALAAGIGMARGEFVALMDADGQNDPADIPAMLEKAAQFDVVSGWRRNRRDDFFRRVLPSRAANWIIGQVTGVKIHDYGCTLKIYRRQCLASFRIYGEMHRFLPALAAAAGAKIAEMEVNHRPRARGKSKYGLGRTAKVLLDLATVKFMGGYLANPIYIFGGWGLACCFASCALAAVTVYNKFFNHIFVKDQPLFIVAIFLGLVGVQMLLLGLLSEIISRIYFEINDRAPYRVAEKTP